MKLEPTFYSVIPATVRYDVRLVPNAKLLYGEITALASRKGYCWATNGYFATLYDVHSDTISEWISQLSACGHLVVTQLKGGRRIHLPGSAKIPRGVGKNAEHSITSSITYNTLSQSDGFPRENYKAVAEHFSKEYQRVYKVPNPPAINFAAANKLIKGHFARGVTVQQINKVITSFLEELRWNDSTIKPAPDLMVILSAKHFNRYMTKK